MVSLVNALTITQMALYVVRWAGQVHNKYKTYDLLSTNCSLVIRRLAGFSDQGSVISVQYLGFSNQRSVFRV